MAESPVSQEPFYRARPVLKVDGQQDERVTALLTGIKMEESEGGMSALELHLTNWASLVGGGAEIAFSPTSKLKLGAIVEVYAGDETQPRELFRGKISALENEFKPDDSPELTILAEDALAGARMARRSKTYVNLSPADVARQIASGLNLRPVIQGLTSPSGVWAQLNESDLAFLRRLVGRFDGDVQIVGEELHVSPRADVNRGTLELAYGGQLRKVRWIADLADQVTGVSVRGWDAANGSAVQAEISSGAHLGPGSGRTGASVLQQAFGNRKEHIGHLAVDTDAEAQAVAQSDYDLRARRFLRVRGVAEGNAELRVGTHVRLTGMGAGFDNTFYVVSTCHVFDMRSGYRTEFGAECAFMGS